MFYNKIFTPASFNSSQLSSVFEVHLRKNEMLQLNYLHLQKYMPKPKKNTIWRSQSQISFKPFQKKHFR